ncbi:MAG: LamG domain-containing protein, partial [Planctomycetota bacterium]
GKSQISVGKSASLNPVGKEVTVEAWIKTEKGGGVILARGGSAQGYTLYLENRRVRFAVRTDGKLTSVGAKAKVAEKWVHLVGVLTAEKELRIYVNGKRAGSAKAPGLITQDPQEAIEIGVDESSTVGDYTSPFAFKGLIDEVRIYHRALSGAEIAKHALANEQVAVNKEGLVLWYSFDKGVAADASGNKNDGKVEGAVAVKGKFGKAMKFAGRSESVPGFFVKHNWTKDMSMFARAMVLAGKVLFIAGPPDVLDEPQAFRQINKSQVRRDLVEQVAAFNGEKGAVLAAISITDGTELEQYDLDSPPVFDGMAAAGGRLYLATLNGSVVCMEGKR